MIAVFLMGNPPEVALPLWGRILAIASSLTGGAIVLTKFYDLVLHPGYRHVKEILGSVHEWEKMSVALTRLTAEMGNNGGSSMRDAIDRIEANVGTLVQSQSAGWDAQRIAHFWADANGQYTSVSRAWAELTGVFPDDAVGEGWKRAIYTADLPSFVEEWKRCVADKRLFTMKHRIAVRDKMIAVSTVAHPIHGKNNALLGFQGFVQED